MRFKLKHQADLDPEVFNPPGAPSLFRRYLCLECGLTLPNEERFNQHRRSECPGGWINDGRSDPLPMEWTRQTDELDQPDASSDLK